MKKCKIESNLLQLNASLEFSNFLQYTPRSKNLQRVQQGQDVVNATLGVTKNYQKRSFKNG